MLHGETMCGLEEINEWLSVIDDTCHQNAKQKGTHGSHVSHPQRKIK